MGTRLAILAARLVACAIVLAGCKSEETPPPVADASVAPTPTPAPASRPRADEPHRLARAAPDPSGSKASPGAGDPSVGDYHLDPDPASTPPRARRPRHATRPIELLLRSTPPGAMASVDGQPAGKTPTLWTGETDGRLREVTFALPGYSVARYRFIPTRSGVVHGTLHRLVTEKDAGPE